ncbi:MAG: hypothetical protein ACTSRP_26625, partial [Candidatus Helarchaeota archaeon]
MSNPVIILVIILGIAITAILILLKKAYKLNPYYQAIDKASKGLKQIINQYEDTRDFNVLLAVKEEITDFNEQMSDLIEQKVESVGVYAVSRVSKKLMHTTILTIALTFILSIASLNAIFMYIEYTNATFQVSALLIILVIWFCFFIALYFSYILIKQPANIKGKYNKLIKLKKGIWIDPKLIGFLGFSGNNKYYEKGVSLWVITFSFLIKIMIIGILGLTLYNTVSIIFSVSRQTSISYSDTFLNVIFSGFTFIAVIYYLSSMNKIEYQKFENYALFYCLLGIFTIIFLDLD